MQATLVPRTESRPMPSIRVLVVDDNDSLRRLLEVVLGIEPDLAVIGMAENATEALERVAEMRPDVVVLDNHMPGRSGIELLPDLLDLGTCAVVMYTAHVSLAERETAARLGVELCAKDGEPKELLEAIRRAAIRRP